MKENLSLQFLYPDYQLPKEYIKAINKIDHIDIAANHDADVVICDSIPPADAMVDKTLVFRFTVDALASSIDSLCELLRTALKVNVIITDMAPVSESSFLLYKNSLRKIADAVTELIISGKIPQLNILTDRINLTAMNNCNAGWHCVTLAPDGCFYPCPAFYFKRIYSIGNLKDGVKAPNAQLFTLPYAPICRKCDAFQCKRCVWKNYIETGEVNIPSHEQCVISHLERNASVQIIKSINSRGFTWDVLPINETSYLDPISLLDVC
ncbi:MAG: CXXX repeat peptide maturase [Bacteroidales bacterium]|nr:CXXX repeat peptide maturase [Bacteroidales bacterium]